jgi:hypothetical protein
MQARFEHLKGFPLKSNELEIACQVTIPVTISVYRGENVDGAITPLYCHIQFEGDGYNSDLVNGQGDPVQASTLEEVSEAFNIPMDARIWNVTIEEEK